MSINMLPARRRELPPPETLVVARNTEHELTFVGQRLGYATSRQDKHTHHPKLGHLPANSRKCHACRWLEVSIYRRFTRDGDEGVSADYVLHTVGGSSLAGEEQLIRVVTTPSAHELIELLTVRKNPGDPFIAVQSLRALALAAQYDPEVENAYVNRALP